MKLGDRRNLKKRATQEKYGEVRMMHRRVGSLSCDDFT